MSICIIRLGLSPCEPVLSKSDEGTVHNLCLMQSVSVMIERFSTAKNVWKTKLRSLCLMCYEPALLAVIKVKCDFLLEN